MNLLTKQGWWNVFEHGQYWTKISLWFRYIESLCVLKTLKSHSFVLRRSPSPFGFSSKEKCMIVLFWIVCPCSACAIKNANALLIWNGKGNGWHLYDWYKKILIPAYFSYHLLWFKRLPKSQYHLKVTRYKQKLNRVSLSASKLVKDLSLCPYMFYQPWQSVISNVEIFYWCCNIGFTFEYLNVLS